TAELEAELDRAEAEAPLADWDEEEDAEGPEDSEQLAEQPEDPNAAKRFWFEHATGAGKTVAALGFVEASRTGGGLIPTDPIFIGMPATGALIARHVTDLFPTQTSRFDLAQAARRGVISPLRCVRISPGVGVRTIAKVPLRRGEVDTEFDQDELAKLLDQQPFNMAVANLYKTRFNGVPGVVYAAGVRHAYNLAEAFRAEGLKAQAVSGETP